MTDTVLHPLSKIPISGEILGEGAVLKPTDFFDSSTTKKWEPVPPSLHNYVLPKATETTWVRPRE